MNTFENLIKPAILNLIAETQERGHRRERDLHHHLTICLDRLQPLRLGRPDRLVWYEDPTAPLTWSESDPKAGNVDFCFPIGASRDPKRMALELNLDYTDLDKIKQDFIKILDLRNGYDEAIYFAFAPKTHRRSFKDTVHSGLIKAFRALREGQLNLPLSPQFLLPMNLHIMVVETCWAANGLYRVLWEASAIGPCLPEELRWLRTSFQLPILQPVARLWEDTNGADGEVSREEAERIHDEEIRRAGIPLSSTTARCMFYATEGKRGKWCRFGATPLWDNCLRVVDGKVSRSELMGWIGRLIESGHKSQKAGQVAYRAVAGIVTEQKVELEALEYGQ